LFGLLQYVAKRRFDFCLEYGRVKLKGENMKRDQILTECAKAVAACWNHYSDVPLIAVDVAAIRAKLHLVLPSHVTTAQWQQYANEYDN
jgi:hypothetical protein